MLSSIDEPAAKFNHSVCVRMQQNGGSWVCEHSGKAKHCAHSSAVLIGLTAVLGYLHLIHVCIYASAHTGFRSTGVILPQTFSRNKVNNYELTERGDSSK